MRPVNHRLPIATTLALVALGALGSGTEPPIPAKRAEPPAPPPSAPADVFSSEPVVHNRSREAARRARRMAKKIGT